MLKKKEKYSCRIFAKNGKQKLNINCWQLLIISIKLYNATLEPNILIVYHIFIKEEEQYFAIEADCSVERGYNSCKAGEHLSICSRSIYFLQCTVGPYFFQFCPIKKNILSQNSIPASAHATLAKVQGWLLPGIKQINVKKHVTVHGHFYRHKVWKEILGWLVRLLGKFWNVWIGSGAVPRPTQ